MNIVDRFDGGAYRRVLATDDRPFEVAVSQPDRAQPTIEILVRGRGDSPETRSVVMNFLERCLGIRRKLGGFYALSTRDGEIGQVIGRLRGLKPVRFPSMFEALVNGIACQQISLDAGLSVLSRLTEAAGRAFPSGDGCGKGVVHAFPGPSEAARLDEKDLREIGFSGQKSRFIIELSRAVVEKELDLESLERLDNRDAFELLRRIRGIGRWTAEYALLRGLGRLDIFPGDDVGVRKKLLSVLHLEGPLSYEGTEELMSGWQPYSGFVYLHLLLVDLLARGYIDDT